MAEVVSERPGRPENHNGGFSLFKTPRTMQNSKFINNDKIAI